MSKLHIGPQTVLGDLIVRGIATLKGLLSTEGAMVVGTSLEVGTGIYAGTGISTDGDLTTTARIDALNGVYPGTFTVAGVPAANLNTGRMIYVSNGAAGAPVIAFSNGTNWLRVDTLAAIS